MAFARQRKNPKLLHRMYSARNPPQKVHEMRCTSTSWPKNTIIYWTCILYSRSNSASVTAFRGTLNWIWHFSKLYGASQPINSWVFHPIRDAATNLCRWWRVALHKLSDSLCDADPVQGNCGLDGARDTIKFLNYSRWRGCAGKCECCSSEMYGNEERKKRRATCQLHVYWWFYLCSRGSSTNGRIRGPNSCVHGAYNRRRRYRVCVPSNECVGRKYMQSTDRVI